MTDPNPDKVKAPDFGLIIIGTEILDGRVSDRHFEATRSLLSARHLGLAYAKILPDNADFIESQLAWAMAQAVPFFSCLLRFFPVAPR